MSIPHDDQPDTTTERSAAQIVRNWLFLSAALAAVTMIFLLFFIANIVMYSQADIIDQPELIANAWICGIVLVSTTLTSVLSYFMAGSELIKMMVDQED